VISRILLIRWSAGAALALGASIGAVLWNARRATEATDAASSCCTTVETSAEPVAVSTAEAPTELDRQRPMAIPDTPVIDHRGRALRFYSDLVKGRVVAINFIFTTCKTICPTQSIVFGQLQRMIGGQPVHLISVSLDPLNDRPEQLGAWARRYGAGPDWTLVTGEKPQIDQLLKALSAYVPDKNSHAALVLVGDDRTGTWRRLSGITPAESIKDALEAVARAGAAATGTATVAESPAQRYFNDVPLVNQYGETMRLYSDVLRGKVAVIHVFFSGCSNSCPEMLRTFQKLQDHLGDRLGRDVHLVSLTVDPDNDTWSSLREHAGRLKARRGWYFLTGSSDDVGLALRKLGQAVDRRESHSNLFIMGNERTGLWKKVQGLAPAEEIIGILDGVIADRSDAAPADATGPRGVESGRP
jgi:cytochrome oxidase Cu insertion factor (SCO1/SenC/PrrC family)